jgi:hypothetical protein
MFKSPNTDLVANIIGEKYRIIQFFDLFKYSHDPTLLVSFLSQYENAVFEPDQRLVVALHDIDYYHTENSIGNTTYNFVVLCNHFNIPTDKIIFLTNHYGIKEPLSSLFVSICNEEPPTIIETSQWFDFPDTKSLSQENYCYDPEFLYCCLNNVFKKHRFLTLCMLKENGLIDQGILSYHWGMDQ